MSNIYPLQEHKVNKEKAIKKARRKARKEGGDALTRLTNALKINNEEDVIFIAKRIGEELKKLNERGIKDIQVAKEAKLTNLSQELYRLRIKPGKEKRSKQMLHKYTDKYVRLIEAIALLQMEDKCTVGDRILSGTSFHPSIKDISQDEELVVMMLKEIVLRVEDEYSLFEKYRITSQLRVKYMRETKKPAWPFYSGEYAEMEPTPPTLEDLRTTTGLSVKEFKSLGFDKTDRQRNLNSVDINIFKGDLRGWVKSILNENHNNYRDHLETLRIQEHYWREEGEDEQLCLTDLDYEGSLLYIPHVYIGIALNWKEWHGLEGDKYSDRHVIESLRKDYENIAQKPLRVDEIEDGSVRFVEALYDRDNNNFCDYPHMWLIIYPNYHGTGVIPAIYMHTGEGFIHMAPVTYRNLMKFKDYEVVYPGKHKTLIERLKELLGHGAGVNVIEKEWRRTSKFLELNPFLREEIRKNEMDMQFKAQAIEYMKREKGEDNE